MAALPLIVGGLQTAFGVAQDAINSADSKRLFKQRTAFQTPQEVIQDLQFTQNIASQGYGDRTLSYFTNEAQRSSAGSIGAALRLGADPNAISEINDSYLSLIMRIGADDQLQQLKNYDAYRGALANVAKNKEAEWVSRENMIKDQMQAAGQKAQAGQQNIQSGLNLALNAYTSMQSSKLFEKYLQLPQGSAAQPLTSMSGGVTPMQKTSASLSNSLLPNQNDFLNQNIPDISSLNDFFEFRVNRI